MAQLVARLVRNEKVRGSNPLSSTRLKRDRVETRALFRVSGGVAGSQWEGSRRVHDALFPLTRDEADLPAVRAPDLTGGVPAPGLAIVPFASIVVSCSPVSDSTAQGGAGVAAIDVARCSNLARGRTVRYARSVRAMKNGHSRLATQIRDEADKEAINDDIVFEIELIKQVEINVDYILMLVEKYRAAHGDGENKELKAEISRAVDASPSLRNKRDLIEYFVERVTVNGSIDDEWQTFIAARREAELEAIIADENLRADRTREFIDTAFRDGAIRTSGTAITRVLPPASRFSADGRHGEKKQRVIEKLGTYFERFFGLGATGRD